MKTKSVFGKLTAVLLMAAIILSLGAAIGFAVPSKTASAATVRQAGNAAALTTALSTAVSGDTIQLTANFTYTGGISVSGKSVTFDLNGHTQTVTASTGAGLSVMGGGEVRLTGTGAFNVSGSTGVECAEYSSAAVTDVTATAGGGVSAVVGANVTVYGSVTATGGGVYADDDSTITVKGNVRITGAASYGAEAVNGGTITVDGSIIIPNPAGTYYVRVGGTAKAQTGKDASSALSEYIQFSNGGNKVYVKCDCQIGSAQYLLSDALTAVTTGQTIKLLKNITYNSGITIDGKRITFDLAGFKLNVVSTAGIGLSVSSGEVNLNTASGGEFNVTSGSSYGVYTGIGCKAAVTNCNGYSTGAYAYGGSSQITVLGNAHAEGPAHCIGALAAGGGIITVSGNVTAVGGDSRGVEVGSGANGGTVTVIGNVSGGYLGVYANKSGTVTVKGDVNSTGAGGAGAYAEGGGTITVDGFITVPAGEKYITVGTINKTPSQTTSPTTKAGYLTYTDSPGVNIVWVKDYTNVTFSAMANGTSGIADSTVINLFFNQAVTGLTADKIAITNGTGSAVKGAGLTGSGTDWTVSLGGMTQEGTVNVSIADFGKFKVTNNPRTVTVYKNTSATVTSVTVSPSSVNVLQGGTQQFTAAVEGTNNPTQSVTWTVSGNNSGGTNISVNGLLTVAAGETAATLTVRAFSTVDNTKSGTATVTVGAAATAPGITGPTGMSLTAGYAATSTGVFIVTGNPGPTVTKTSGNAAITWNNTAKKLDIAAGLAAGNYPVVLTASNSTLPDATVTFTLTVMAAAVAPTITTAALTGGTAGTAYTQTLTVTGDTPITWSIYSGKLPNGLILNANGTITGIPTECGTHTFTVKATNSAGSDSAEFSLIIAHNYGVWTVTAAPATANTGTLTRNCSNNISHTETFILPVLSTADYFYSVVTAATCEATGTGKYTLNKDGQSFEFTVILAAIGHSYGTWTITAAPATANTGTLTRNCSNDISHTETFILPVLSTADYFYSVVTAAACEATGAGKYTLNKDGQSFEFTVILPATGHSYGIVWERDGVNHWHECDCGSKKDTVAHTLQWIVITPATIAEDGERANKCNVCGYIAATEAIPATGVPNYNIIGGGDGTWNKDADHKITADGDFSKFVGVKVDGVLLGLSNYDAATGSTVITLKKAYLDTLSVGVHTVEIIFTDNSVSTTLTIAGGGRLPGGAIAAIIIGSVVVLFLGGFAIFRFVIKKKKRA